VLHDIWDPPNKIIAELGTDRCCGVGFMATGNDHDPSAEYTSLGCDVPKTSQPKHDPHRAVLQDGR
jgi:hypothetical protein